MRTRPLALLLIAFVFLLRVSTLLAEDDAREPLYPPAGLDMSATDPSIRPGDDFYRYANGAWLARMNIPTDRPFAMEWQGMRDRTATQLRGLIEAAAASAPHEPTTTEGKVGAFYKSFMDSARLEALGVRPISTELAAIRASRTPADVARLMGNFNGGFEGTFIDFWIDADPKDPERYAVTLYQNGLSLPDRDYYLKADFAREKQELRSYAEQLLTLSGWASAKASATAIVALETRIARASWSKVEQRDPPALYNPMSPAELAAYAPGFPWRAFLRGAGLASKTRVIVAQKTAFPRIAKIFADTPLETLKAWLAFTVLDTGAPYLSSSFASAHFHFHDHVLLGIQEQPARWKLGVRAVSGGDCFAGGPRDCFGTLNWAVGQMYTARYFLPETKKSIEAMVANITQTYRRRLERLDWMSDTTRAEALRKLDTYVVKVGYPDRPRDYSSVVIKDDDLIGNIRRAAAADWGFYVGRSDGPVDKSDWVMTPQTVDAYNGGLRDIVFPAAILQPPGFDPYADAAVNYGAAGWGAAHELTHGFDDEGRTVDAHGALRDWWTEADAREFKARTAMLGAQFATFEPLPGLHINPELTMGENIADLGGLAIALEA
ncbi:MAG TPA: M13 family metallopeptidase, partial [Steroidobacteraceae bacterium]|nr:M13 family metallopeptidase [Steroidobacteraceae bacterium]